MGVPVETRFWYSPSRHRITWREPSESIFDLAAPLDWRPLVVIDPEDREQVERLCEAYVTHGRLLRIDEAGRADNMQAALCSLVTPPKPDEPQGLGAVVEDADGVRWVSIGAADMKGVGTIRWRQTLGSAVGATKRYAEITVREIKSQGWSE